MIKAEEKTDSNLIFGKARLSNHRTTLLIYKNNEFFGQILVDCLLDIFFQKKEFATISFYRKPHYQKKGRVYQKNGYLIFYNLQGVRIAECMKKEALDLIEEKQDSARLYNPDCLKKQLDREYNFSSMELTK